MGGGSSVGGGGHDLAKHLCTDVACGIDTLVGSPAILPCRNISRRVKVDYTAKEIGSGTSSDADEKTVALKGAALAVFQIIYYDTRELLVIDYLTYGAVENKLDILGIVKGLVAQS